MEKSKSLIFSVILSMALLVLGVSIAFIISKHFKVKVQDVIFWEGLCILTFGLFSSMQGNPSGIFLSGLGAKDAQYHNNENLEVIRTERRSTNYYLDFKKHTIAKFTFTSLSIVFSGFVLMFLSLAF